MSFGFTLDTSKLDALHTQFPELMNEALRKTAQEAEGIAASYAAVQTGAMRAGVYSATSEGSTYAEAAATAKFLNPKAEILPEVATPPPGEAILSDVTGYAARVEFGTSLQPPQPFLTPAIIASEAIMVKNVLEAGKRF